MLSTKTDNSRTGFILATVLICLALALVLFVALLSAAAFQRRTVRVAERRSQCHWLVQAGLERAAANLAEDESYQGEKWLVSKDDLAGTRNALVQITIQPSDGNEDLREVLVTAEYPRHETQRLSLSRQFTVNLALLEK